MTGRAARWGWPGRRPALLALALGLGVALGQVPFTLPWLSLPALALLLHRIRGQGPAGGFWLALFAGAGHFALALSWIVQPFLVDPWTHGWMAPFALLLLSFGLALFWGLAAALALRSRWPLAALVAALALSDLARGHLFTGFPWALFGHVWLDTPVEQAAAWFGGYGLSLLTLALAALPLALSRPWQGGALAAALVAALVLGGMQRQQVPAGPAPGGIVRLVQPAIAQRLKWDPEAALASFEALLDLTVAPPRGAAPQLAIWPETAVPYLLTEGEGAARAIGGIGLPVLAGIQRVEGDAAWNSLALIGPGGSVANLYDKIHLVPFGEYVPFGDLAYRLFGLRAFAAQLGFAYSAGTEARLVDLGPGLGRARALICYEAIFPEEIATPERPALMVQITNDAWFGTLTGPYQHFALARLRAIEQGLPLLRVANTGISAVVTATGQIAPDSTGAPALLALGPAGVIDAPVPGPLPPPPYARAGDWPLAGLLLAILGLGLATGRRRNKA
ncbi:MAG: apolipoprotein N-acyltransferase [Paracoccaceae bacterium]